MYRFVYFISLLWAATNPTIEKFQHAWDATLSYEAKFKQTVTSKQIGAPEETTGKIYVLKPGKLRWDSETDGSVQILNGKKLISIQENRRRKTKVVDIYNDISKAVDTKAIQFLAGKSQFQETYKIEILKETPATAELKLVPKGRDALETYIAEIDKKSYFLRSLTTESADTRVRIEFLDVKSNAQLDEKVFDYTPSSSDVVHKQ